MGCLASGRLSRILVWEMSDPDRFMVFAFCLEGAIAREERVFCVTIRVEPRCIRIQ